MRVSHLACFMGISGVGKNNWIAFRGPRDLLRFSVFKADGDKVEIASPFGKFSIRSPKADWSEMAAFACYFDDEPGGKVTWGQKVGGSWQDMAGVAKTTEGFKAKKLGLGSFEPVSTVISFRGLHAGLSEHAIVLLPGAAESIAAVNGGCQVVSQGLNFVMPKGKAANLVLSGSVQWGLPNEKGVFVLGEMPV